MSESALPSSKTGVQVAGDARQEVPRGKPFPKRLVVAFLLVVVATGATVVAVRSETSSNLPRNEEDGIAELERRDAESFAEFDALIQYISLGRLYNDESPSLASHESLRRAEAFYSGYIERSLSNETPEFMVGMAHSKLGSIWVALRDFRKSDESFTQARRIFRDMLIRSRPDRDVEIALALTNSRFSCVLATIGKLDLAKQLADDAVTTLRTVCKDPQVDPTLLHTMLVSACNLAILNESSGENGVDALRACIARCSQSGPSGISSVSGPELLVDANQLLMRLLWNAGRWDEAEAACMKSSTTLEKRILARQNSRSAHDDRPTHRHQRALSVAHRNLRSMHECRDNSSRTDSTESSHGERSRGKTHRSHQANSWQWRQLSGVQGQSIDPEILTHGKVPGEFEHQDGLLLAWSDPEWGRKPILEIIKATYEATQIILLVRDSYFERQARVALAQIGVNADKIRFAQVATDTVWIRDYGPLAIQDNHGATRFLDSEYRSNARFRDDRAPIEISRLLDGASENVAVELELEWGALVCNGDGLCLVSSTVLQANQDRGIQEAHITNTIKRLTGSQKVIYLAPVKGEPTGHLDMLLTFAAADTVVVGEYQSRDSDNARLLNQHAQLLATEFTGSGKPLKVVRVPMPPPAHSQFAGSYTNVVFANGKLLVPRWSNSNPAIEQKAFDTYQRLLPEWKIEGIDCHELGLRGGALHCTTMNLFRIPIEVTNSDS